MARSPEHTEVDRAPVGWVFWLWSVLASAVGRVVGDAVGQAVVAAVDGPIAGIALVWLLRRPVTPGREAVEER